MKRMRYQYAVWLVTTAWLDERGFDLDAHLKLYAVYRTEIYSWVDNRKENSILISSGIGSLCSGGLGLPTRNAGMFPSGIIVWSIIFHLLSPDVVWAFSPNGHSCPQRWLLPFCSTAVPLPFLHVSARLHLLMRKRLNWCNTAGVSGKDFSFPAAFLNLVVFGKLYTYGRCSPPW